MSTLETPSPRLLYLMKELHRQQTSGEELAGYWYWFATHDADHWTFLRDGVSFKEDYDYKHEPSPDHPHFKIYNEWAYLNEGGAFRRGEFELYSAHGNYSQDSEWVPSWHPSLHPSWQPKLIYEIRKSAKHPDNLKNKTLTPLNWYNAPLGTKTSQGVVLRQDVASKGSFFISLLDHLGIVRLSPYPCSELRVLPATQWTARSDDEAPPEVEGLVIEYRYWSPSLCKFCTTNSTCDPGINAYRVTGLAPGYTDDSQKGGV